jgi:glutathione S-transferase
MSTCTRKVLMTAAELGTPHELVLIDFAKGEHKQPPHLARQPFGRIPTIDHDGFTMFESRAIARYLNELGGGALSPDDPRGRAKMEQWISVETSEFSGAAMKFVYHHVFQRKQDDAVLATARTGMEAALRVLDEALAGQQFLVGDKLSLADIVFMPYIEYTMATPAKEIYAPFANVAAWWTRISERPSWRRVTGKA